MVDMLPLPLIVAAGSLDFMSQNLILYGVINPFFLKGFQLWKLSFFCLILSYCHTSFSMFCQDAYQIEMPALLGGLILIIYQNDVFKDLEKCKVWLIFFQYFEISTLNRNNNQVTSNTDTYLYLKTPCWIIDYKHLRRYTSVSFEENNKIYFGIDPAKLYREMSNSCFAKGRAGRFFLKIC